MVEIYLLVAVIFIIDSKGLKINLVTIGWTLIRLCTILMTNIITRYYINITRNNIIEVNKACSMDR